MTTSSTTPPTTSAPETVPLSPTLTAIIATVETMRAQLRALEAALDAVVDIAHASAQASAALDHAMRSQQSRRRAEENMPAMPPVFGASPFTAPIAPFTALSLGEDHGIDDRGGNPIDRIDRIDGTADPDTGSTSGTG